MKKCPSYLLSLLVLVSLVAPVFAQKGRKPIIFAVLDDGKTLEPIAFVEKGALTAPVGGDADAAAIKVFNAAYYKPKSTYRLIFGAANAGTVTVASSDPKAECSANQAQSTYAAKTVKLGGMVMGLATDAPAAKSGSGVRRKPTAAEKTEVEALVKAEFASQKVAAKVLRYQNLTALDLDNDKKIELVGSYWVETGKTSRALLFFIAGRDAAGKLEIGYGEFKNVTQDKVMSGDIKTIDAGVYHELLLDAFDYDGDGSAEVFTYIQGFEGSSFNVYKKDGAKWTKAFEGANYHCGY